jgi:hypothetical protein
MDCLFRLAPHTLDLHCSIMGASSVFPFVLSASLTRTLKRRGPFLASYGVIFRNTSVLFAKHTTKSDSIALAPTYWLE